MNPRPARRTNDLRPRPLIIRQVELITETQNPTSIRQRPFFSSFRLVLIRQRFRPSTFICPFHMKDESQQKKKTREILEKLCVSAGKKRRMRADTRLPYKGIDGLNCEANSSRHRQIAPSFRSCCGWLHPPHRANTYQSS